MINDLKVMKEILAILELVEDLLIEEEYEKLLDYIKANQVLIKATMVRAKST